MKQIFPFLILVCLLFGCKKKEYIRVEGEKESGSMVSLRDFYRFSYDELGQIEWKLQGSESYIYPKEKKTIIYGFQFTQYEKGVSKSKVTGDRGEIDHNSKNVQLNGNVKLKTEDGRYVESDSLVYNLTDKTLFSDSDVLVYSDGTTIRGKGLRVDKASGKFTILRPNAITVGGKNPLQDSL